MNTSALKLNFPSGFYSVTTLANQEGFRGLWPIQMSEGLAATVGYVPETVNWRTRHLLATAASVMRRGATTPCHCFRLHDAIEGRRFRMEDEVTGERQVFSIIVPIERGTDEMLPDAERIILLMTEDEMPRAA